MVHSAGSLQRMALAVPHSGNPTTSWLLYSILQTAFHLEFGPARVQNIIFLELAPCDVV